MLAAMAEGTFVPPARDEVAALFVDGAVTATHVEWHERVAELRRTDPVPFIDIPGIDPFWVATRHGDVFGISRDNIRWHNTANNVLGLRDDWERMVASGFPLPASLVSLDGVKHRQHRKVTDEWIRPAAVGRRQPRVDEIADLFVQRMRDLEGECDFAVDVAQPYTLRVIMDIYGVPEEDEAQMMRLTHGLFGSADPEFMGGAVDPMQAGLQSIMEFTQYFAGITQDRQACPTDDLASVIANADIDGCPIGEVERLWYYIIVATAGHDTTSFGLSGGLDTLMAHPDQWQELVADPDLVPRATDEIIRWTTPVRHFLRYAVEPMEVRGTEIPEGGRVLLSYPSANRDEDVFVDAESFDITRTDADRLASFGGGAHFCLGAQFARMELRTMLRKLTEQLDWVEPAGESEWMHSHFVAGVKHLPVRYAFK
jgi:cytochrome P450